IPSSTVSSRAALAATAGGAAAISASGRWLTSLAKESVNPVECPARQPLIQDPVPPAHKAAPAPRDCGAGRVPSGACSGQARTAGRTGAVDAPSPFPFRGAAAAGAARWRGYAGQGSVLLPVLS